MKTIRIAVLALFACCPLAAARSAATVPVTVQGVPQLAPDRTLTMTGTGFLKVMPDKAIISGGVVSRARRSADAVRSNNDAMAKAVTALKALGIADKDINTASFSFEPQYETDRNGNIDPDRHIEGYIVTNRIAVTLTDKLERAGEVLDTLLQNGANDSAGVVFELSNLAALEMQARALAGKDALARAQTYCRELGAELGPVRNVIEGGQTVLVDKIEAYDIGALPDHDVANALQRVPAVALRPSLRIAPQEVTISKSVTVMWGLK